MFRGRIEPPYREVPLNEPIAANFFDDEYGLAGSLQLSPIVRTYNHEPLDETPICLIDERYGKIGKTAKKIATSVGAIFDPSSRHLLTTGVLISEELFLTSGHYSIKGGRWLTEVAVSFNFEYSTDRRGNVQLPGFSVSSAKLVAVSNNPDVDFALFRVKLRHLQSFATISFERGSDMLLIGHREGQPKKASYIDAPRSSDGDEFALSYAGKTGEGVSGAPLFTIEGKLYAIHSYAHQVKNAVPLKKIMRYLTSFYPSLKKEIDLSQPVSRMLNFNFSDRSYANSIVLTYDTYRANYRMPFLGFQYEVYEKDDVKNLTPQAAANLPKKAKNLYNGIKRDKQSRKHDFIENLKLNGVSDQPFTPKFQNDHTYQGGMSKRDQAQYVASTRGYGNASGKKSSSIVDMTLQDANEEIETILDDLDPEDLIPDENEGFQIRRGTIYTTEKEYPMRSGPVMFSGNGKRAVGEMDRTESSFDFAPKIVDGKLKIHHFDGM